MEMDPLKWSLFVLLTGFLLLGLPNGVEPDAPSEETKSSSAKECKVHIEKAMEQYWDQKQSFKYGEKSLDQTESTFNLNLKENEKNNDEDEDQEDDEDDDDADDASDDEIVYDNDEEVISTENKDEKKSENIETENNNDKDEDDETDTEKLDTSVKSIEAKEEKDNIQGNGEDEEEEEEEEEDEYQGTDDNNLEKVQNQDKRDEYTNESETSIVVQEDDDNHEAYDEDDDDHDDNENDDELEKLKSKEYKEADEAEGTIETIILEESSVNYEDKMELKKAIGETDRASDRMVSELPKEKPPSDKPQTQTVQEEIDIVTSSQRYAGSTQDKITEQKSELEDDEDDDEDTDDDHEESDNDTIENIYEDDDDDSSSTVTFRSRNHIDVIFGLDDIGTEYEKEEETLAQSIFKEIKKIELTNIKPMEMLYKYTDSTTRVLGDAEIFNKPMLLFLGPWNSGKTTIINYLLGIEGTTAALKTGTGITDVDFTLVTYGDRKQIVSGTELAIDWRYAGVQKYGQGFLDHFRSISLPSTLLRKVTLVDTPGILENKKNTARGYPFNDVFQWFIDRADAIYVVLDPTKVDIGGELGSVLDQLKGRDVRFILNKADTIRKSDLMRVVGQLFWNLSPLMSSTEAPVIYAVSLSTKPFHPASPARFLADQEKNFLYDMKETLDKRVEHRILYARKHAVRVRNHAKMVDCYLATYYRHKSIFSNKKNVAKLITENPREYSIFEGLSSFTNVSRYDIPNPNTFKEFFKLHPLYDFKPLASTCSYFRGCPMDKLDAAIAQEIPELFTKYKKAKGTIRTVNQDGR